MVRLFRLLSLTLLAASLSVGGAASAAQNRVALVIGNGAYTDIGALKNASADGVLMADSLRTLGFDTTALIDANQTDMKRAIAAFGRKLRTGGKETVGLFYYAGHGIQADGRNYLMPIEAAPLDEADLDLVGVDATWVLRQMESANNSANIVILDACRNNPLGSKSRSGSGGLAQIDAPAGAFIAYATSPGSTAVDGQGANSPFTAALVDALREPERPIEQVFKDVRRQVLKATGGLQTPWDSSSLTQDFFFKPRQEPATTPAITVAIAPPVEATPAEISLWQSISASGDAGRIALFLQLFPNSEHAPEARGLMMQALAGDAVQRSAAKPDISSEHEMIALAQTSGVLADYASYLASYPDGVFADLARAEISHIVRKQTEARAAPAVSTPAPAPKPVAEKPKQLALLSFDQAIPLQANGNLGSRSLRELSRGMPEFPPIEGLDPVAWKGKSCSTCHNWSEANLCDQGKFYGKKGEAALKRKKHPFGGEFKLALSNWAKAGCR